jgi:hypothetical protein
LCKTPPCFSAMSSVNYEIITEMFLKCVIHTAIGYLEFPHWSVLGHSEVQLLISFHSVYQLACGYYTSKYQQAEEKWNNCSVAPVPSNLIFFS